MSVVDNIILTFSILEDSVELDDGSDRWPLLDRVNEWLVENASGQRFGKEINYCDGVYVSNKNLETPIFVAAFNFFLEDRFFDFLHTLPWEYPEEVQYIVQRQNDSVFSIRTLEVPVEVDA